MPEYRKEEHRSDAYEQLNKALDMLEETKLEIEQKFNVNFDDLGSTAEIKDSELRYFVWMARHYEATAKLHLGLLHRALGEHRKALESYNEAKNIFEKNNEKFSVARVLNNQAYIEARMGKFSEAYGKVQEALKTREKIKDFFGLPLSLAVKAYVEDRMGLYPPALKDAQEAKSIVKKVFPTRTIRPYLYASLDEARTLRHMAEKRSGTYDVSMSYLENAEKIMKELEPHKESLETYYLWEFHNEYAQVLLRKAWIMGQWNQLNTKKNRESFIKNLESAKEHFERAHQIAKKARLHNQIMDNLDDWSGVYIAKIEYWDEIKELLKEQDKELYDLAMEKIDEGRKEIEIDEVVPIQVRQDEEPKMPRYNESFYRLGSLYYRKAYIVDHYGKIKGLRNKKLEAIKNLLMANVLYDLYTDQPMERISDTRMWLLGKLEVLGSALKAEEMLRQAIKHIKEHVGVGIKLTKAETERIENLKSTLPQGFVVDPERKWVVLKLNQPAEKWDEAAKQLDMDNKFLQRVKREHKRVLKVLPIWSEISLRYPKLNITKLLKEA